MNIFGSTERKFASQICYVHMISAKHTIELYAPASVKRHMRVWSNVQI